MLPICRYPGTLITQRRCAQYFRYPCASHRAPLPPGFSPSSRRKPGPSASSQPCEKPTPLVLRCATRKRRAENGAAFLPKDGSRKGKRTTGKREIRRTKKTGRFRDPFPTLDGGDGVHRIGPINPLVARIIGLFFSGCPQSCPQRRVDKIRRISAAQRVFLSALRPVLLLGLKQLRPHNVPGSAPEHKVGEGPEYRIGVFRF